MFMMFLFFYVLDLLVLLDSSRIFFSIDSLDDFLDGDVFGLELDIFLDLLFLVQGGLFGSGVFSELFQLIFVFFGGILLLLFVVGGFIFVFSLLFFVFFGLVMDFFKKLVVFVLDVFDFLGFMLDFLDLLLYLEI